MAATQSCIPSQTTPVSRKPESSDTSDLLHRAAILAGAGAWSCDLVTNQLEWTPGVYALFGLPDGFPVERDMATMMYAPGSREAMERARSDAIARRGSFSVDAEIIRTDGQRRWIRITGDVICKDGEPVQIYGFKQDITDEWRRADALRRMAECDGLTGLANRGVFQSRFLAAPTLAHCNLAALVLLDVDGFKQVNDRYGHAAGDAALRAVGQRLHARFPDSDLIARIGGDEFAVLVPHRAALEAVQLQVEQALSDIAQPIPWQPAPIMLGASAGIAFATGRQDESPRALFDDADAALYAAKHAGKGCVRITRPRIAPPSAFRMAG